MKSSSAPARPGPCADTRIPTAQSQGHISTSLLTHRSSQTRSRKRHISSQGREALPINLLSLSVPRGKSREDWALGVKWQTAVVSASSGHTTPEGPEGQGKHAEPQAVHVALRRRWPTPNKTPSAGRAIGTGMLIENSRLGAASLTLALQLGRTFPSTEKAVFGQ